MNNLQSQFLVSTGVLLRSNPGYASWLRHESIYMSIHHPGSYHNNHPCWVSILKRPKIAFFTFFGGCGRYLFDSLSTYLLLTYIEAKQKPASKEAIADSEQKTIIQGCSSMRIKQRHYIQRTSMNIYQVPTQPPRSWLMYTVQDRYSHPYTLRVLN